MEPPKLLSVNLLQTPPQIPGSSRPPTLRPALPEDIPIHAPTPTRLPSPRPPPGPRGTPP
eukprot:331389-Rhodomonas_salina.1